MFRHWSKIQNMGRWVLPHVCSGCAGLLKLEERIVSQDLQAKTQRPFTELKALMYCICYMWFMVDGIIYLKFKMHSIF